MFCAYDQMQDLSDSHLQTTIVGKNIIPGWKDT